MAVNINSFLTDYSRPYYDKILNIIETIKASMREYYDIKDNIITPEVYIFGGFVRRLIEHYYDYQNSLKSDTKINFTTNFDIDIWFDFSNWWRKYQSYFIWSKEVKHIYSKINDKYKNTKILSYPEFGSRLVYGLYTIYIEDIKFDMCTNINHFETFSTLCDFTCNNLYIDLNGNIYIKTKSSYSIQDCFEHIKNKILINIINQNIINDMAEYSGDRNYYTEKILYREQKMLNDGYRY